jgi:hypothetical protein
MLLPGQRHDSIGVDGLLDGIAIDALIADKAFDNNTIRTMLAERGALAVIPSKADRKTMIPHDIDMYRWRHLVEKLLRQNQAIPKDCNTLRQNRHQLRGHDPRRRYRHRPPVIVNKP